MTDTTDEQGETMNTGLSIAEREVLHAGLRELPDTMPPRAVWNRIEVQARAEGLLPGGRSWQNMKWIAGAAIAATVALAVLRFPATPLGDQPVTEQPPAVSDTPDYAQIAGNGSVASLNALMVQSQQLERNLRSLPNQRRVVRAGTEATITELEDRIAAIDYRLNHPRIRLTMLQAEIYWRERVRLMNLLVNLRYAQAQRMAF